MWLESHWVPIPPGVASNTYQTGKNTFLAFLDSFVFNSNNVKKTVFNFLFLLLKIIHFLCRLAGVALVVPVVNYWWPSLPESLIRGDYRRRLVQWSIWLAHYAPGLLYWWATQKWIPSTSVLERNSIFFNNRDIDVLKTTPGFPMLTQVTCPQHQASLKLYSLKMI